MVTREVRSYRQPLEVLLDRLGQAGRFGVQVREFGVDLAHGRREVEVLVLFLRGDPYVAAGREAPVVGLNVGAGDQLDEAGHVAEFAVGEALGQPVSLTPEVAYLAELVDGGAARPVGGLVGASDGACVSRIVGLRVALLFAGFGQAGRGLV